MKPDEMRELADIEPADHFLANVDGSTNYEWPELVVGALRDAADQIDRLRAALPLFATMSQEDMDFLIEAAFRRGQNYMSLSPSPAPQQEDTDEERFSLRRQTSRPPRF